MCSNKVTTITVFLLIIVTNFLLFTLSTWKSSTVEPRVQRKRQNINLKFSFRVWDCTLIYKNLKGFFYSTSNNSLLFSVTQINQHKEWLAALWIIPSTTQKAAEWLVHTPPDNFENNSINCCQISSVGKNVACLLYWKFWIISPFLPSSFNFSSVALFA